MKMSGFLDKQHPTPVYIQLKEMLQNQIELGMYGSHQKLPSERHLCQYYKLSRMTARRALQELITAGFAYTSAGKGTFVSHTLSRQIEPGNSRSNIICSGQLTQFRTKLIEQLLVFDSVESEKTIQEVLAIYPAETVVTELFLPIVRQVEQLWLSDEIGLLTQNYAVTTIRTQLITLINNTTNSEAGQKILMACAPTDQHEIGLLSLAFSLRYRGFSVTYLGNNTVEDELYQVIQTVQPTLICFSAMTKQAAELLITLSQTKLFASNNRNFAFGGVTFCQYPTLISKISGLYLGDTIETAVVKIESLLSR